MKPSVYIETSIIGYLTSRISRDIITAANQQITQEWWEDHRGGYDLYVSQYVLDEVASGNPQAAQKRLQALNGLPLLTVTEMAGDLAQALIRVGALPTRAGVDALHMAVAAVSGMNYLLTWNCRHIANAVIRPHIETTCRNYGYQAPVICTPYELIGWAPPEEESDVEG